MSSILKTEASKNDKSVDLTLRPRCWSDYIGQEKLKRNLEIIIKAAKQREEQVEHILFYGGSGLGKTTISQLIAKEIGSKIHITSGPSIGRAGDIAAVLTSISPNDVIFIDEIHRLRRVAEECLYPAMEEFNLNLILGKGAMAQVEQLKLPPFTLIGATTKIAMLSAPLRSRFGAVFQLDSYKQEDIKKIISRSSAILGVDITIGAIDIIAERSRFNPRVANRLLKRVRDFAQIEGDGKITESITKEGLDFLEIDEKGLEPGDKKILKILIEKFKGGPAGIQALAASSAEEEEAILDVYEPYLIRLGFIKRTPRGRVATELAYGHLGIKYTKQGSLDLI